MFFYKCLIWELFLLLFSRYTSEFIFVTLVDPKLQEYSVISTSFVKSVRTICSKLGTKNVPLYKKKTPNVSKIMFILVCPKLTYILLVRTRCACLLVATLRAFKDIIYYLQTFFIVNIRLKKFSLYICIICLIFFVLF